MAPRQSLRDSEPRFFGVERSTPLRQYKHFEHAGCVVTMGESKSVKMAWLLEALRYALASDWLENGLPSNGVKGLLSINPTFAIAHMKWCWVRTKAKGRVESCKVRWNGAVELRTG
ncbi:hypothetical protein VNI00_019339 [Paramarasmius palmivorus]|uniref:Uncharacterized protein n=1 Tax=Paramarasmius palmivorus TaxID=297713 RepID=A0AAW0ANG6_9AGAR